MAILRFIAQLLLYVPLMFIIGYFSSYPRFTHLPEDRALLRLSFSHAGERLHECRQRSPEELANLSPNMRAQLDCPRERSPLQVEVDLDDKLLFRIEAQPSGLRHDGASTVYRRLELPTGTHRVAVRLRDRAGGSFNRVGEVTVDLRPGATLLVDFDAQRGGFRFRS
jgi:hypothetical protein